MLLFCFCCQSGSRGSITCQTCNTSPTVFPINWNPQPLLLWAFFLFLDKPFQLLAEKRRRKKHDFYILAFIFNGIFGGFTWQTEKCLDPPSPHTHRKSPTLYVPTLLLMKMNLSSFSEKIELLGWKAGGWGLFQGEMRQCWTNTLEMKAINCSIERCFKC